MILLNGREVECIQFPNGETKFDGKFISSQILGSKYVKVTLKYESDNDLIKLFFVKKHLDLYQEKYCKLMITYMPYSRMDRVEGCSVFTLKYISEFINSLNFSEVIIVEPHSDVTPALINNCQESYPSVKIFHDVRDIVGFDKNTDYVYYPDTSSNKRYSSKLGKGFKELIGLKKRDFETGNITSLQIIGDVDNKSFKVIMIDDLSSKGTTFFKGAEKLRELGASEIYLVVGHCEDTIYEGEVLKSDFINQVFTTDSILTNFSSKKINVFKI